MISGNISKMHTRLADPVVYELPFGDQNLVMNDYIGREITLTFNGNINCVNCGKKTNKSYSQGHCYPCMAKLASCDMCIMKPETCHFDKGTCREPEWAEKHCMQPHYVYLANSSGVKVGITRETQIPTRWIDQGAIQAIPIAKVDTRYHVGLMEVAIKSHVADKTNWRKMLKNETESIDLSAVRDSIFTQCSDDLAQLSEQFGEGNLNLIDNAEQVEINYPVTTYPEKIKAWNFDKTDEVAGVLNGIKGQYLLLDTGVLNIRKFSGYHVTLSV